MTEVEAVELVLKGPEWVTCPDCDEGYVMLDDVREYCGSCDGNTQILSGHYVEACDILGKDYPPHPNDKAIGFQVFETIEIPVVFPPKDEAIRALLEGWCPEKLRD